MTPNLLRNASFEQPSLRGWLPPGLGNGGTQTTPGVAREGSGFGTVQTTTAFGDRVAQDVAVSVTPRTDSYNLSLWVRSASGKAVPRAPLR